MSWIVAVIGPPEALARGVAAVYAEPRVHVVTPGLVLAAGGPVDTLHVRRETDGRRGVVVAGAALNRADEGTGHFSAEEWWTFLRDGGDPQGLDGHFVGVWWEPDRVTWFTDALGQRTVYTTCRGSVTTCSTRLDWLARSLERATIDLEGLGSRWLCFHSFTPRTGVSSIEPLGPNGRLTFHRGVEQSRTSRPFTTPFGSDPASEPIQSITSALRASFRTPYVPSLGLSGGLDSRLLLATFMREAPGRFVAHTFGTHDDPDMTLAIRMAEHARVEHVQVAPEYDAADALVQTLHGYAAATHLTEPVTSAIRLAGYERLTRHHRVLVDGGFGEMLRRQYFNRLVVAGSTALRRRDARRILPFVRTTRAGIFRPDAVESLERGAVSALAEALAELPPDGHLGPEDAADLLAVRTRIPYYGGPEQARLDGLVLNLMPLAIPSTLRAAFALPVKFRRNARWVYKSIRALQPPLAGFPLAKGGVTVPFGLPMLLSRSFAMVRSRVGPSYVDGSTDQVLQRILPMVRDLAASAAVRQSPILDATTIERWISAYESGDRSHGPAIAWWLTFEWWRRSVEDRDAPVFNGGQLHVTKATAG